MNKTYIKLTCKKKKTNFLLLTSIIENNLGISCGQQFQIFFRNDDDNFYIVGDKISSKEIKHFLKYMFIANVFQEQEIKLAELSEKFFWLNIDMNMQGALF